MNNNYSKIDTNTPALEKRNGGTLGGITEENKKISD